MSVASTIRHASQNLYKVPVKKEVDAGFTTCMNRNLKFMYFRCN